MWEERELESWVHYVASHHGVREINELLFSRPWPEVNDPFREQQTSRAVSDKRQTYHSSIHSANTNFTESTIMTRNRVLMTVSNTSVLRGEEEREKKRRVEEGSIPRLRKNTRKMSRRSRRWREINGRLHLAPFSHGTLQWLKGRPRRLADQGNVP